MALEKPMAITRLSTHVLDLTAGQPAAGMAIALYRLVGSRRELVTSTVTNTEGRTERPLLDDEEVAPGRYELSFSVRDYFAARGIACPFLEVVPIVFEISLGERYHVPLLVTPWSYSTYRGS